MHQKKPFSTTVRGMFAARRDAVKASLQSPARASKIARKIVFLRGRCATPAGDVEQADRAAERRLVELFSALASISSPTGSERACGEAVTAYLEDLGLEVHQDGAGPGVGGDCDNLYCRLPATTSGRALFFCAHLDTVPATDTLRPVVRDGVLRNATPSIVGADNKAALAVMLEALRSIVVDETRHAGLELVLTVGEEQGLVGSTAFDCSVLEARVGYVFDHPGPIGGHVVAAPSRFIVRASMHGRSAHVGIAPEEGVNAIVPLARAIASLPEPAPEVSVNVVLVSGGTALNVVPDRAETTIDVRSLVHDEAASTAAGIERSLREAAAAAGCTVDVDVAHPYSAYRVPDDSAALALARTVFSRLGLPPSVWATRGGSDANVFCKRGLDCLNLTHAVESFHAPDERVAVSDLVLMRRVMLAIVDQACSSRADG
jgi:tripeptide aminopeptidase